MIFILEGKTYPCAQYMHQLQNFFDSRRIRKVNLTPKWKTFPIIKMKNGPHY